MDTKAYLERINYHDDLTVSSQTLRRLQLAHLYAVPFENLSIHHHEPIVLNEAALFDKIVARRRGGFCYELNGLFAALLRTLGFQVDRLAASVAYDGGARYSQNFSHMTLLVTFEDRWLVDVGFGDSFRQPLRLDEAGVQAQFGRGYRIESANGTFTMWEQKDGEAWQPQYRFTAQAYDFPDYAHMCHYHQTSPESHFTQNQICSLATPDGRLTLSDNRFISTTLAGERNEKKIPDEQEFARLLHHHFGIVLAKEI